MNQRLRPLFGSLGARPLPWFLLGVAVFLYLRLFVLPFTPILMGGDQSFFLTYASRMLDGQLMYRDFFQFTPPGTSLVYLALFEAFGKRAWIPNVLILVLGVSLTWLTVSISRKIMGRGSAFLAGLLFLTFIYVYILDATHHRYSLLAVMAAVAVVIERRALARLIAAGALCGAASFFTQSRGAIVLIAFSIFLVWETRSRKQGWAWLVTRGIALYLAFAATLVAANAYFIWTAGLARVVYCQVTFFLKHLPSSGQYMVALPHVPPWPYFPKLAIFLFIHALLPLVYLLFFARYYHGAKSRPAEHWDRLMLVNIVGLLLFTEVVPAVNWIRLFSVALPALIVFVWFVSRPGWLYATIERSLWVITLTLALTEPWRTQRHWRVYLDLPVGRAAFTDKGFYDKCAWLLDRTRPRQFLFEGAAAGLYFPLDLRNPAYLDKIGTHGYGQPEQIQQVIESLESHRVQFVIWSSGLRPDGGGDHLGPLRAYLRAHYRLVKIFFDSEEAWERNP
ncbi:MAG TPA: hypothetical protein VG204_11695 [Terriglobia bacterium]|nr:hypothetical protein [Terriglobia bacterium]